MDISLYTGYLQIAVHYVSKLWPSTLFEAVIYSFFAEACFVKRSWTQVTLT